MGFKEFRDFSRNTLFLQTNRQRDFCSVRRPSKINASWSSPMPQLSRNTLQTFGCPVSRIALANDSICGLFRVYSISTSFPSITLFTRGRAIACISWTFLRYTSIGYLLKIFWNPYLCILLPISMNSSMLTTYEIFSKRNSFGSLIFCWFFLFGLV